MSMPLADYPGHGASGRTITIRVPGPGFRQAKGDAGEKDTVVCNSIARSMACYA